MPARKKVNLGKVLASLNTVCPKCGHEITPAEMQRPTADEIKCPKYGVTSKPERRTS
jgi:predicted RNA-binding Zn-ribbon protein involved in translation (DUF1610 family)